MNNDKVKKMMKEEGFVFSNSEYKGNIYYTAIFTDKNFKAFSNKVNKEIEAECKQLAECISLINQTGFLTGDSKLHKSILAKLNEVAPIVTKALEIRHVD